MNAMRDQTLAVQPIPRTGEPEEVARLVLFLACHDGRFSTGSEFVVDGVVTGQVISQPIEVPKRRTELAEAFGRSGYPHMVLRVGFGRPGSSPPRRPMGEVVEVRPT